MEFIMYFMLLKNEPDFQVSKNFTAQEYLCKCNYNDCNFSMLYYKTADSAQRFRDYKKKPLATTSGHRCQRHNHDVNGVDDSYHMKGHAVDFEVPYGERITVFSEQARMFFDVVIEYPDSNFIHCHNL